MTSLSGGEYSAEEVIDRLAQAFFAGGAAGGAMRGGVEAVSGAGSRLRDMQGRADKADQQQGIIDSIAAQAEASMVRQRSPERFQQAVARATEGGPAESVYIPAEQFSEYFQSLDRDPFDVIDQMDGVSRDDFEAALAGGGDVRIPTATYAAQIAGTEHDAALRKNMRFNPNDMTASEAEAFRSRADAVSREMLAEVALSRAERERATAAELTVYNGMAAQLRQAGQTKDVADKNARVWTAWMRTMADRTGTDLSAFSQRFNVRIQGPGAPQPAAGEGMGQGAPIRRGSIMFSRGGPVDGETIINLFETADLSTLTHESGHFFLEAMDGLSR